MSLKTLIAICIIPGAIKLSLCVEQSIVAFRARVSDAMSVACPHSRIDDCYGKLTLSVLDEQTLLAELNEGALLRSGKGEGVPVALRDHYARRAPIFMLLGRSVLSSHYRISAE
jgi:hypothetical protein